MSEILPNSRSSNWKKSRELFFGAMDVPEPQREVWLDSQAAAPEVLDEVRSLLAALQKHEALSGETRPERPAPVAPEERLIGELCGAYRLTRLIGTGGMAWVYEAQRDGGEFEQVVAVKVLPAVFGVGLLERFRREKQILAGLNHPGIAHLLDGGTTAGGLSYLVMEYVAGERITTHAGKWGLSRVERIGLFLKVCEAVEFAHQGRVVHRDLKPANILVSANGQPKLLDFGIAQLMDVTNGGSPRTLWRAHTPGYASPEQLRGEAAGVASDVYQLGVLLAELMGDLKDGRIGADLAAIIAKARRPEPLERYASVALLADDLNRYLAGRPVEANRGAAIGRAGKFIRRHPIGLAVLLLGVAAAGVISFQIRSRKQAELRRAREIYTMVINQGNMVGEEVAWNRPEVAAAVWRRLSESVEKLAQEEPGNPVILQTLGQCYLVLGSGAWFRYGPSMMDPVAGLQSYTRARDLLQKADVLGSTDDVALDLSLGARIFGISEILMDTGHGFDGFGEAVRALEAGEARHTAPRSRRVETAADLASYYDMLSDRIGARMWWPLSVTERAPRRLAEMARWQPSLATDSIAASLYEESLSASARDPGLESTPNMVRLQLGRLQHEIGRGQQGIPMLQKVLHDFLEASAKSPNNNASVMIASVRAQLSRAAEQDGHLEEALAQREESRAILEKIYQSSPQSRNVKERVGEASIASARLLSKLGRKDEALRAGRAGLELLEDNAKVSRPAALTMDMVAQRFLTVEPAELRDTVKGRMYARRAVEQTAGQMPIYLMTLAFAEHAAGNAKESEQAADRALEGYRRVATLLRPLFESARYPEARRIFEEWQGQLARQRL